MNASESKIAVLIADDQALFRNGVRTLLESEPDISVVGETGAKEDVLDLVGKTEPDIVLLDWAMAGSENLKLLHEFKAAGTRGRVIILTTVEDRTAYAQAVRLGTSGIVSKKTPTDLLLKSIRRVHAGEVWLDRMTTAEVMRAFICASENPVKRDQHERKPGELSRREREIAGLIAQGFRNKELADKLFISEQTVKNHLHNIFDKLGVSDRLELALYVIHHGMHEAA